MVTGVHPLASLRQRADTWYIYCSQGGTKRGRSLKTKSKAVADEFLKEFEYRLAKKELGQELDATLDSLKMKYLGYCKTTKKTSTYERHDPPRVTRFVGKVHAPPQGRPAKHPHFTIGFARVNIGAGG